VALLAFVWIGVAEMIGKPSAAADQVSGKSDAGSTKSLAEGVAAQRSKLATQIADLEKQGANESTDARPEDVSTSEDELEYLQTLDSVFAQQQSRIEQLEGLRGDKKKVDELLESLHKFGPSEAKPYSFLLLENLRDELAAEEDQEAAFQADLKASDQMLEMAQEHFDEAESERRRAQEAHDEAEAEKPAALLALKLAKQESQINKELVVLRRLEVEVRTLRGEVCQSRKTLLEEKVERISKDVRFTKQDLEDRLKELAAFEADLNRKLKEARARFQQLESQEATALKALREEKAAQATLDLAVESWRVARDVDQTEMFLLNERIGDSKRFRHYWACRYEVENGTAKADEIAQWHDNLSDLVAELQDNSRSLAQRVESSRSEQAKVLQRVRNSDDAAFKHCGDFQGVQWQGLRDVCESNLVQLKASERWCSRFLEELQAKLQPADATSWRSIVETHFAAAWVYEIAEVDDRPVTVGKVVTLLGYLMLDVLLARVIGRVLRRRVLPRLGLNDGASQAVQSIAVYTLIVLFGVLSFQFVHIPLTAFAFLGGAVAIAIGFGSQDVANNFMSGIILLAEQPIRMGDVVVIDDVQGTVQYIGPRSTRIKTNLNHELIIPNSKLLSDKVTNLTLSDNLVQTAVSVTLPVKLTVQQAKQTLLEAASSHPTVLRDPHPIVLFKQFGASSMDLELHFWLRLNDDMMTAIVQSEVREAINELFQRDDAQPIIASASLFGNPPAAPPRSANAA
jgi:potassium efflux system protein